MTALSFLTNNWVLCQAVFSATIRSSITFDYHLLSYKKDKETYETRFDVLLHGVVIPESTDR